MKKMMMLAAAAMALSAGVAGAQKLEIDNGTYAVQSCNQVKEGVRCDLTFTSKTDDTYALRVNDFEAVMTDGTVLRAGRVEAGGTYTVGFFLDAKFYKGVPGKITLLFPTDRTVTSLAALGIRGQAIVNIAVRNSAAPAPVATPAPAQINISGTWNATLTNCKQSGATVVCTATLRK